MLKCARCGKPVSIKYGPGSRFLIHERINSEDGKFDKAVDLCDSCLCEFSSWLYSGGYGQNRPDIPMLPVINTGDKILKMKKQIAYLEQLLKQNGVEYEENDSQ